LVRAADIWIDNYPPRVAKRLGLTPNELLRLNPELVALTITGYSGERVDEPGYDIMIQAESGLMGITGPAAGAPHKTGVAIVDVLTGLMAANGVLAALFRRERRGKGARLAISLHQTALYSLVNVATNYLVSGEPSARWGNAHANIVPYQDFQLADRSVIIGVGNDRQFHRLCKLLHIQDPALTELDNRGRVQQRDRVLDAIRQKLSGQKADPLLKRLREAQIPAAPILRPDEALARVPTWNAQSLLAVEHPTVGTVKLVANPLTGAGIREQHQAPPQLDEGGRELAECWLKNPMWRG
jgi:succinate--hydroxymethylglutarate CoA-transferase